MVRNIFLPGNLDVIDTSLCLGYELELNVEDRLGLGYTYLWVVDAGNVDITPNPENPDIKITPNTTGIHILNLIITDPNCSSSYSVTATINVADLDAELLSDPMWSFREMKIKDDTVNIKVATQVSTSSIELMSDNASFNNYTWTWDETETSNSRIIDVNPKIAEMCNLSLIKVETFLPFFSEYTRYT